MSNISSNVVNVHVNPEDKIKVTKILNDLGLNMTTLINMTIKQVINNNGIPFNISLNKSNNELEKALEETIQIEKEYKEGKRKGYKNAKEMMESIISD